MPELPEVETTRRGIEPHILGLTVSAVVVRDARLRWPVPKDLALLLAGQTVEAVERRGKYLLLIFGSGTLLIHLGMSGSLRVITGDESPSRHDHLDIEFGERLRLRLNDPRRFGAVIWTEQPVAEHSLIRHLGPEPLTEDFSDDHLFLGSRKRSQAIKTFIMDSRTVVGVGNIYANEALFQAGIRPTRAAGRVSRARYARLTAAIRTVLARAIEQGGTTLKDFVGGDGKPGYFKQALQVYGRGGEPCLCCQATLKEVQLGQRTTVYCPRCQT